MKISLKKILMASVILVAQESWASTPSLEPKSSVLRPLQIQSGLKLTEAVDARRDHLLAKGRVEKTLRDRHAAYKKWAFAIFEKLSTISTTEPLSAEETIKKCNEYYKPSLEKWLNAREEAITEQLNLEVKSGRYTYGKGYIPLLEKAVDEAIDSNIRNACQSTYKEEDAAVILEMLATKAEESKKAQLEAEDKEAEKARLAEAEEEVAIKAVRLAEAAEAAAAAEKARLAEEAEKSKKALLAEEEKRKMMEAVYMQVGSEKRP